ncbi:uncharacterized protein LOC134477437 isoform X1 [Cavia porcellus]|uniref:uncharacterized protein LOC134477437 isoform X1 n=1 Tax=Cavia porcellus TaxID=10141 RepID=UPI002FDFD0CA
MLGPWARAGLQREGSCRSLCLAAPGNEVGLAHLSLPVRVRGRAGQGHRGQGGHRNDQRANPPWPVHAVTVLATGASCVSCHASPACTSVRSCCLDILLAPHWVRTNEGGGSRTQELSCPSAFLEGPPVTSRCCSHGALCPGVFMDIRAAPKVSTFQVSPGGMRQNHRLIFKAKSSKIEKDQSQEGCPLPHYVWHPDRAGAGERSSHGKIHRPTRLDVPGKLPRMKQRVQTRPLQALPAALVLVAGGPGGPRVTHSVLSPCFSLLRAPGLGEESAKLAPLLLPGMLPISPSPSSGGQHESICTDAQTGGLGWTVGPACPEWRPETPVCIEEGQR